MIKNRKHLIVLSVITLLCLCLCLSACGKNNKTSDVKDSTTISQNQTDDQPKVVHQKDGSGVETIGSSDQSGQTAQKPSSGKKTKETSPSKQLSSAAQEYADYCAMSSEKQYAYYKSFKSADAFMKWYNVAKAAYEKENPAVELNPGDVIDLGN